MSLKTSSMKLSDEFDICGSPQLLDGLSQNLVQIFMSSHSDLIGLNQASMEAESLSR